MAVAEVAQGGVKGACMGIKMSPKDGLIVIFAGGDDREATGEMTTCRDFAESNPDIADEAMESLTDCGIYECGGGAAPHVVVLRVATIEDARRAIMDGNGMTEDTGGGVMRDVISIGHGIAVAFYPYESLWFVQEDDAPFGWGFQITLSR